MSKKTEEHIKFEAWYKTQLSHQKLNSPILTRGKNGNYLYREPYIAFSAWMEKHKEVNKNDMEHSRNLEN